MQPDPDRAGGGSGKTFTRSTRYGIVRYACLPPEYEAQWSGCPVVHPAWMVVDLARTAPRDAALVVADAVLHQGGATKDGLEEALGYLQGWSGSEAAERVVAHADGGAESPLETLGRLAFIEAGLPVPLSNVWVGVDRPRYRVDHLLPWHWVAFEGDGMTKYRDAADLAEVIAAEKRREHYLRWDVGLDICRYGARLTRTPESRDRLAATFRKAVEANPVRQEPVRWWPTASKGSCT